MPEAGRTQLLMMLMQQAGPGALPLSILPPSSFIPFVRAAEQLCIDESLAPIVVYWSRHSAARLLPGGPRYRQLMRDAYCVSIFSEERTDPPEEWCVLIESRSLSLIAYGLQAMEATETEKYQCTGSLDPQIVRQSFNRLLPTWQFIDLTESNRLEDARVNVGYCNSVPALVQQLRSQWPVVKSPIQQSLILPEAPIIVVDQGKISPIAMDGTRDPQLRQAPGAERRPSRGSLGQGKSVPPAGEPLSEKSFSGGLDFSPSNQPSAAGSPPASEFEVSSQEASRHSGVFGAREDLQGAPDLTVPVEQEKSRSEATSAAQTIIGEIIGQLRHSSDLSSILQFAIENLTKATNAERGLIWQIVGDQLQVTNEYSASGHTPFVGRLLPFQESTAILLEFLSRFPDDSGAGVISIPDTWQDTNLHKMSPMLSNLMELGEVKARLMVQLRSRGRFSGFLELEQSSSVRNWSREDAVILQGVAEMLSFVVQQTFDQSKIEMDAREMKLINEIASLFRESRGQTSQESLVKSVMLVAEHMGFVHSQIYLFSQEEGLLLPQIQNGGSSAVSLAEKDNPFVGVFESGRGKVINMEQEYSKQGDSFFGKDVALVLPLVSEGERLGVVGLWKRQTDKNPFRTQDRELGLTIAGHLSNVIRAEQAIMQIRADQARAALINKVSSEIRQSLKEVDQIMETLVTSLRDHFDLALCVVSLYDVQDEVFGKSKISESAAFKQERTTDAGEDIAPETGTTIAERLFLVSLDDLRQGKMMFLTLEQIKEQLSGSGVPVSEQFRAATLVPLVHAGNFKAALCMMQSYQERPLPNNDMMMVADLADRVAVVVSHAELFAQVERQAVTDPMTALFNRRYFQEQLAKEIDRYQRFGHAFSLIIVDLDYLKKINDTLGHNSGDLAIKHIANVLRRNVRDVDTVGRYGGEEFVVLLPETDLQHARMVSERICAAIREKPVEGVGTITASLGLATYPNDAQDGQKLFELADDALYLAKQKGRNCVCSVSEDLLPSRGESGSQPANASLPGVARLDDSTKVIEFKSITEQGLLGMVAQLAKSIEERDLFESDRSIRASNYAQSIADSLHWSKQRAEEVTLAAVFSNIGKLDIPQDLLRKQGPLSAEELEQLRRSPTTAAKFLKPAKLLDRVGPILEAYKEHWDGSGYPKGLKGEEIPVEARIVAIVDAYINMTTDRPYRKRLSHEEAMKAIRQKSGKEYDPRLVKLFLSKLQREQQSGKKAAAMK